MRNKDIPTFVLFNTVNLSDDVYLPVSFNREVSVMRIKNIFTQVLVFYITITSKEKKTFNKTISSYIYLMQSHF